LSTAALVGYATYLPRYRLQLAELAAALGSGGGRGARVVASFDEDSTTMAVEAARAVLRACPGPPAALYFATTAPAYGDKTNATAIHAAIGLPSAVFAADLAGAARSAVAAWRAAAATGGLAVCADVRTGRPGSGDERAGADGAVALLWGDPSLSIADTLGESSLTVEVLDRWRAPGAVASSQWEERFGVEVYLPLIRRCAAAALESAGIERADHVVVVSPNAGVTKQARKLLSGALTTRVSPVGHCGAADLGLGLACVLDEAGPGETILAVSAADGCDAIVLRTTDRITVARQRRAVAEQLADGLDVSYPTYLSWRGWLQREPPRRPDPDRPAAPPSARAADWKFSFTGTRCGRCKFVHLPPTRVCKKCGTADDMEPYSPVAETATVATYTVDRLAFSPSPPVVEAVVDFAGGGRYTLEVADAQPARLGGGTPAALVFRRLFTAGDVHNYFWKARVRGRTRKPGEEQQ
jgi:3-hydroxy-3-methylglutaryl CoA synthase/uncharacterized OB-fold protein